MSRPLVSIVIAAYCSRRDHLSAAITSALGQTWADVEVIVSDDSPHDDLRALVAGFRDPRLRYRRNAPALGVAANHWALFGEARGEYVTVLNHDDWRAPTFVERLAHVLQREPDVVLAFCDHWVIDESGRRLAADTDRNSLYWGRSGLQEGLHRSFATLVIDQSIPMAMGAMFRRSALPATLPSDAGPAYDLWMTYLLCRGGGAAWYVPDRLSAWRTHPGNLTSEGGLDWLQGSAACWRAMSSDDRFASVHRVTRLKAAMAYSSCAVRAWTGGQRLACAGWALQSLRARLTVRGVIAGLLTVMPSRLRAIRRLIRRTA